MAGPAMLAERPELATARAVALNNFGTLRTQVGGLDSEGEEALVRAVKFQRLAAAADWAYYAPNLAETLTILANTYRVAGRLVDALPPWVEAMQRYSDLVEANRIEYLRDLALLTATLAVALMEADRDGDALALFPAALKLYEGFTDVQPDEYQATLENLQTCYKILRARGGRGSAAFLD